MTEDGKRLRSEAEQREEACLRVRAERDALEESIVKLDNELQSKTNALNRETRRKESSEWPSLLFR